MAKLGYHISHEQFAPSDLLRYAKKAEEAGFTFCLSSDHFHPWTEAQGESGFAWSWLGAAMAQTSLSYGIVNCPTMRYHPAIIAQAAATLDEMFPGRFWVAAGSGQALNESIMGEHWPDKTMRNARLKEAVSIMRDLWNGETVTRRDLIKVENAKLYTRPKTGIEVVGAAITPETASWAAGWADALITVSKPIDKLREVVDAWKQNGGENKPMLLKVQLSYDTTEEEARSGAHDQWKSNVFGSSLLSELKTPNEFEQAGKYVEPGKLDESVNISSDPQKHIAWIEEYANLGFERIVLHNVNRKQEQFIEAFGEKVLPAFAGR
ncbi:TIGR03885 family FMN-dependent LLM class oxidoreductase [uncultured Pontibacter sp.]|uniref:TIGR03885 family FMN-dependent LLM class oxidoreductase n=1 Tax=uncultured Pontibacter sp. TaxID=453356 RepID=UPI002624F3CE|nr:TIGR03885 family FMN-dependent LLM class oxidoreductase [uncultured Pontibacter sp.]